MNGRILLSLDMISTFTRVPKDFPSLFASDACTLQLRRWFVPLIDAEYGRWCFKWIISSHGLNF